MTIFHTFRPAFLPLLTLVFAWSPLFIADSAGSATMEGELKLVWSADYGRGWQVYYSSCEKNGWTAPLQLSQGPEAAFSPSVGSGDDGKIWVVWSIKDSGGSFLVYTFFNGSGWRHPEKIPTGLASNGAASIILDRENTPWIAWEGRSPEARFEDIYWSRWSAGAWSPPARAHEMNDVPDLRPALLNDASGGVILSWKTFADGGYMPVYQVWDGRMWQAEDREKIANALRGTELLQEELVAVQDMVQDPNQAALFINDREGKRAVRVSQIPRFPN